MPTSYWLLFPQQCNTCLDTRQSRQVPPAGMGGTSCKDVFFCLIYPKTMSLLRLDLC